MTTRTRNRLTALAAILLAVAVIAYLLGLAGWGVATTTRDVALFAAAVVAVGPIAQRAWAAARVRAFSIDLLVTIAVVGALIIGELVEAAAVSFLFLFGAWLEARSLAKTRSYLHGLIELSPTRATVRRPGATGGPTRVEIDADDLVVGDVLLLTTGERIAADAVIISGTAEIDESTITGEPLPATKTVGDKVFAGTVLATGYVEAEASAVGGETTFSHIITLVEEAQETRTPTMRFLEKFAQIYTPAVIVMAIVVFAFTRDVEFALTFLVIACPGALVISVPVAIVAAVGNLARHGVLVTSGEGLERLAAVDTLFLDKTGTLTSGRPVLAHVGVADAQHTSSSELLRLAASVEVASEHHLARAILAGAEDAGVRPAPVSDVLITPGLGVSGTLENRVVSVGRLPDGITAPPALTTLVEDWESTGMTAVYVTAAPVAAGAGELTVVGALAISDELRSEARGAVDELRSLGIRRTEMLTGDNQLAADRVAAEVGLDGARGRLLPQDKAAAVAEVQAAGGKVLMVGDGVNDAPALATADVGVAMGGAGTDVSRQTADVVLMTDHLSHLAHARRVARKARVIMTQNVVIALGTVGLLIAGVLARQVGLAGGMLVHEVSVIAVVLNALRLVRLSSPSVSAPAPARYDDILVEVSAG